MGENKSQMLKSWKKLTLRSKKLLCKKILLKRHTEVI